MADTRAMSPVISKAFEASLVVLFIALLSSTLYGTVVPDYRSTVGAEVGERTLALGSERIQQAVPPNTTYVTVRMRVSLPDRIRGDVYVIRVENRSLVLDHPHSEVRTRTRLALPTAVQAVEGEWVSDEPAVVAVRSVPGGLSVSLTSGGTG